MTKNDTVEQHNSETNKSPHRNRAIESLTSVFGPSALSASRCPCLSGQSLRRSTRRA